MERHNVDSTESTCDTLARMSTLQAFVVAAILLPVAGSAAYAHAGPSQDTAASFGAASQPSVDTPRSVANRWATLYPTGIATRVGARIAGLLADPKVTHAHWGIAVTTLDGMPLYGLDEAKLFRPASTAKLFTTTVAMSELGPLSTVKTTLSFADPDSSGTIHGDLILKGDYDANFGAQDVPWSRQGSLAAGSASPDSLSDLHDVDELAAAVAAHGVRHITGRIVAESGTWDPYPQGWEAEDLAAGYGAPVSMLSVHDNTVHVTVQEAKPVTDPAAVTLFPDTGLLRVVSTIPVAEEGVPTHITVRHTPGDSVVAVTGSLQAGKSFSTEFAMDDPPFAAAVLLRQALLRQGVAVDGAIEARHPKPGELNFLQAARTPIPTGSMGGGPEPWFSLPVTVAHTSPTLAQDVVATLKESLNLHAELMLRRLGEAPGVPLNHANGQAAEGARLVHQRLVDAGISDHDFVFYDGSGLSTKDLVTPRAEAQLLAYAATQPWFAQWKAALPVGGVDGTLVNRFTQAPLKGQVFAKTGTLGESRALAGFVHCASGREVIFAILDDDHEPASSADRIVMDKIVEAIAELD